MCGIRTSSSTRSGLRLADEREHLRPRLRLADDLEAAVRLERALDPVEDEPMVVGDHDAHGDQCGTGLRRRFATPSTEPPEGPPNEGAKSRTTPHLDPRSRDLPCPERGLPSDAVHGIGSRLRLKLEGKHTGSSRVQAAKGEKEMGKVGSFRRLSRVAILVGLTAVLVGVPLAARRIRTSAASSSMATPPAAAGPTGSRWAGR